MEFALVWESAQQALHLLKKGMNKYLQYSCLENPMNSMKRQKDRTLKDELSRSVGAQQPTPIFLPGESDGQRSLVGYSPKGCKESDMTEQLRTAQN